MPKRPANRTTPTKDETGRTWPPPKQARPKHYGGHPGDKLPGTRPVKVTGRDPRTDKPTGVSVRSPSTPPRVVPPNPAYREHR
jgi:hypothetical protein